MQAQPALKLDCQLTCPHCGLVSTITMPTDACQFFLDCPACAAVVSPKAGDCCVFCSYGSVPCPPVQHGLLRGAVGLNWPVMPLGRMGDPIALPLSSAPPAR